MLRNLNAAVCQTTGKKAAQRCDALIELLPPVSIVAIGGFPCHDGSWMGITEAEIKPLLRRALGLGSVFTYMNPRKRSLEEFGDMARESNELWHANTLWVSICLNGFSRAVHDAFARDRRFVLSWAENLDGHTRPVFMASGSVKDWLKFVEHVEDPSFKPVVRSAMAQCRDVLATIW